MSRGILGAGVKASMRHPVIENGSATNEECRRPERGLHSGIGPFGPRVQGGQDPVDGPGAGNGMIESEEYASVDCGRYGRGFKSCGLEAARIAANARESARLHPVMQ